MIGDKLKDIRENLGLQQKQVAAELDINDSTYSGYEANKFRPSYEVLIKLADYFHVSVDYLLGRDEDYVSSHYIKTELKHIKKHINNIEEKLKADN